MFQTSKSFTVDEKLLHMVGIDIVTLPSICHLYNILYVHLLSTHLVYINKLIKHLLCDLLITLMVILCMTSSRTRGLDLLKSEIDFYINEEDDSSDYLRDKSRVCSIRCEEVYLLHQRLGHPSLKTMKILFLTFCSSDRNFKTLL